jgi:tellurite resistance protein TehA-like permease
MVAPAGPPGNKDKAMFVVDRVMRRARLMEPGGFALVMATGIVSVDVTQHGMPRLGQVLFWLNCVAYTWLLGISILRLVFYRDEMVANFVAPGRGASFLTLAAGTCVLATQCILVVYLPVAARVLAAWGALCGAVLVYLFLFSCMTRRVKASFSKTINGSWLVVVVATQSLGVVVALFSKGGSLLVRERLLFAGVNVYLIGCAWYLVIITLITYRMLLLPLNARQFTPPYWINMGALAISTLAGSLIILNAPPSGPLHDLLPFIKGFTLFYWASATFWIPLLAVLEAWRHILSSVPVNYEVDDWDIVFPLGMYTVCTTALSHATGAHYLMAISDVGVYVSLLVWVLVGGGLAYRLLHRRTRTA